MNVHLRDQLECQPTNICLISQVTSLFQAAKALVLYLPRWLNWRRETGQTFTELPNTASAITLIPRDLKCHWGSPVGVGIYGGQVMHGVLAQIHHTVVPVGPHTNVW